ncbi:hypothetical protein BD414DRAFT_488565 [Trametes punicea]|nr:hypothetical protein BD414DRAFT_488565 [Trametes punicea]
MCFTILTYCDWLCGYRQYTGTHQVECNRPTCRLSAAHRDDDHDCQRECTGRQMEDQHLIMEHRREMCPECAAQGRGRGEHPGARTRHQANGTNGAIEYRHLGNPGPDFEDN